MKAYTDITILLDRSGSMGSIKKAMEAAYDSFIKEHGAVESTKVTLVEFDDIDNQHVVYQCVPVGAVERLNLKPRGNTPLIDAFVKAIDSTGKRFANMSESERPDQVLMVVITDGLENASHSYRRNDVRERVTKQSENYKWQFVYLGANQDAIAEAASYGIQKDWAMFYNASPTSVSASSSALTANTVAYTQSRGAERSKSMASFTSEQRKAAEEK